MLAHTVTIGMHYGMQSMYSPMLGMDMNGGASGRYAVPGTYRLSMLHDSSCEVDVSHVVHVTMWQGMPAYHEDWGRAL